MTEALVDEKWKMAMEEEYNALMKNRTWTLVDLPAERKSRGILMGQC